MISCYTAYTTLANPIASSLCWGKTSGSTADSLHSDKLWINANVNIILQAYVWAQCRKSPPPAGRAWMWELNQRWWYPSCSKTGNPADVVYLLYVVSISLGVHWASFSPVMKLSINFSLTLARSKSKYRHLRFMVVTGMRSRISLWNVPWDMSSAKMRKLRNFLWSY